VTVGVRRRDGGYSTLGRKVTYDTIAEVIKRLGERAHLPVEKRHSHVLRHTLATRYYHKHKDLAGLQRLLGHADIRTTMRYVHVTDDLHDNVEAAFTDRRARDRAGRRLNNARRQQSRRLSRAGTAAAGSATATLLGLLVASTGAAPLAATPPLARSDAQTNDTSVPPPAITTPRSTSQPPRTPKLERLRTQAPTPSGAKGFTRDWLHGT
jgi:hypothetical protein